ncbi:hypothetical protein LOK49_LG10G00968 [Camellia lanceoleosa]|uniref:Uncharacterized protein n=1 Tax=Camellia lanceoleosa TaxID=1840588 RepID=A0ACC0G6X2_9ERIC|nr:hypothetical protein LOK49_LG10G00968 [Camellia lanceoleosa]
MGSYGLPHPPSLLFSLSVLLSFFLSCSSTVTTFKGIDVEKPNIDVIPSLLAGYASSSHGSNDVLLCERIRVAGQSRLKLGSYASAYQVTLVPSVVIPERSHNKIQICFHKNASRGLCQCEKDEWKAVQKGLWSSVMSPYEDRYVDVKFIGEISGPVTLAVEDEFQRWRLLCLAFGFVLLLLAPVVSSWVPFYYSSSMAIGVLLVIIILLFQGMKLLPTGRKNVFYLTLYGSVVGAGSFLLHQLSTFVNSILVNFGLSEEMHNPVSVFVLLGIVLAGAALGYWIVRKFVISEDGSVDVGIAQFVKWAMRVIAAAFIFQSTLDTPLAMGALVSCLAIYLFITLFKWNGPKTMIPFKNSRYSGNGSPWQSGGWATAKHNHAEFRSRSGKVGPRGTLWNSPRSPSAWSDSPVKGLISSPTDRVTRNQQDYYSTFHNTPTRRKMSKKEWETFTKESTREAVAELASSPEFTDWMIKHADRLQLLPDDTSDETLGSGSDSTDENAVESCNEFGLFKWQHQK